MAEAEISRDAGALSTTPPPGVYVYKPVRAWYSHKQGKVNPLVSSHTPRPPTKSDELQAEATPRPPPEPRPPGTPQRPGSGAAAQVRRASFRDGGDGFPLTARDERTSSKDSKMPIDDVPLTARTERSGSKDRNGSKDRSGSKNQTGSKDRSSSKDSKMSKSTREGSKLGPPPLPPLASPLGTWNKAGDLSAREKRETTGPLSAAAVQCKLMYRLTNSVSAAEALTPSQRASWLLPPPVGGVWLALPHSARPQAELILQQAMARGLGLSEMLAVLLLGSGGLAQLRGPKGGLAQAIDGFHFDLRALAAAAASSKSDLVLRTAVAVLFAPKAAYVDGRNGTARCLPLLMQLRKMRKLCMRGSGDLESLKGLEGSPPELAEADFSGCYRLACCKGLGDCRHLEALSLADCTELRLDGESAAFPVLPRLAKLSLSGTRISCLHLPSLQALRVIRLCACPLLEDASELAKLPALEFVDLRRCSSLTAIGDLGSLARLVWLNLGGCIALPPDVCGQAWRQIDARCGTGSFCMWPLREPAQQWLEEQEAPTAERRRLHASALRVANRVLQAEQLGCRTEEIKEALAVATQWGLPPKKMKLPAKTLSQLAWKKDEAPTRMEGLTLLDFDRVLLAKGYDSRQVNALFSFLDKEQKGYVTEADMEVLDQSGGPASLEDLVAFRRFLLSKFSSIDEAYMQIASLTGTDKGPDGALNKEDIRVPFESFVTALQELEWPGGRERAQEIFVALDAEDHDGAVALLEFRTIDLFLSAYTVYGVERLANWIREKFGPIAKAFGVIDRDNSGAISSEEVEKAIIERGHPDPDMAMQSFRFLDADYSDLISKGEFQILETFSANFFMSQLQAFIKWLGETFGDYSWAFDAFMENVAAALVEEGGVAKQVDEEELGLEDFRGALRRLRCPAISDFAAWASGCGIRDPARSFFNFFDCDSGGKISREEWTQMLYCFNINAAREGIKDLKLQLEKDFGEFGRVHQALLDARHEANAEEGAASTGTADERIGEALKWPCGICGGRC
mmetsp:Transcript_31689/g.67362  ORF Transcript_31689/g.67362 Transcript_31689/m.67362 type:complete len:1025 (-) Transcript_31689:6-3080(-)